MTYLVVNDIEDRGVYRFDSRGVAEKIAVNFKNYVFMHDDELEKALSLAGVSDVTDALFLIRKYNSKKNKDEKVAKETTVNNPEPKKKEQKEVSEHKFIKLFNKMKESGDTIRISLVNGDEYVVSVKSYFLNMDSAVKNMLTVANGEPVANSPVLDNAIKNNQIICLPKTKVEYVENYMILTNCDDKYSPNYRSNPYPHYEHEYTKVAIDMDTIASVSVIDNFDFGSNESITSEVIVKYLVKKML